MRLTVGSRGPASDSTNESEYRRHSMTTRHISKRIARRSLTESGPPADYTCFFSALAPFGGEPRMGHREGDRDMDRMLAALGGHRVRVKLIREPMPAYKLQVTSSDDVWRLVRAELADEDRERCLALGLDRRGLVICNQEVSVGSADGCRARPAEVFRAMLLAYAAAVVVVHNHPSGDPTPSPLDVVATQTLRDAGALLGVPIVDEIIVGSCGYFSMRALGAF